MRLSLELLWGWDWRSGTKTLEEVENLREFKFGIERVKFENSIWEFEIWYFRLGDQQESLACDALSYFKVLKFKFIFKLRFKFKIKFKFSQVENHIQIQDQIQTQDSHPHLHQNLNPGSTSKSKLAQTQIEVHWELEFELRLKTKLMSRHAV